MRFWRFAQDLSRAVVPDEVVDVIRLGRLTALQKPNGGVRGTVVGDIIRRLVATTIAQQFSSVVEQATAPFQYALSTKAGGECIAHTPGPRFDARRPPFGPRGDSVLPFVVQFYGNPICENTILGTPTKSGKAKAVSKVIPSWRVDASSPFTTISTSCLARSALVRCTAFWPGSCGHTVASESMEARFRHGIVAVSPLPATMLHDEEEEIALQSDPEAQIWFGDHAVPAS